MKIAIHHRAGSFSERWIAYCEETKIDFMIVDCFDTNIINVLLENKITHLMWHFNHSSSKDIKVFPYVFNSVENLNIQTFPNFQTRWHFDDKVAQKYILESIDAPLVPSHVFYSKEEALKHLQNVNFPIVAKLKKGAGATNVKLLKTLHEAKEYVNIMFTLGKNPNAGALGNLDQKLRLAKKIKDPIKLLKKIFLFLKENSKEQKSVNNEKGYFYYQEFMPNNQYDTRVIVIGDKAIAIRRNNRENDFRASGSGKIDYDCSKISTEMIRLAFETSNRLNAQCLAYDFVYEEDKPRIIEICFGFSMLAYDKCEGYWDKDLNFKKGSFNPQEFMIKYFLN